MLEYALAAAQQNLSVLPPRQDGSKAPDSQTWATYQSKPASAQQIQKWYSSPRTGLGVVCGSVSGGLECIDFDDRATLAQYETLARDSGLGLLLDRVKAGYFEHTPNGAHLIYRCSEIGGNQKLAKRVDKVTLIETKGEGGYIITAPTSGNVNKDGDYVLVLGGFDSILIITPDERRALLDLARTFDQLTKPEEARKHVPTGSNRAGDEYNERANWADILEPHGWVRVAATLGVVRWRRPGKKIGVSATTNIGGSDLLYPFSTNADPFEAGRGYGKFSAYALLNHGGNFKAASSSLYDLGYGIIPPGPEDPDLSGIMAECGATPKQARERLPLEALLNVPGIVGELAKWITVSAIKPQPVLAVGAAIAAVGTVIGRKVMTETRLRSNIYCLGVGYTGCGKEQGRQCIKQLFGDAGAHSMLGDSFGSGAGVEQAIQISASCIYLVDEIAFLFREMRNKNTPGYKHEILKMLLEIYGESASSHQCRTLAGTEAKDVKTVISPCLSLWCTTVPGIYEQITNEMVGNGTVSRFLVFESDNSDPEICWPHKNDYDPPARIVDWVKGWMTYQPDGGDLPTTDPTVIPYTTAARNEFAALEDEMRARKRWMREAGNDQGAYTRVMASAMKLALIRAVGCDRMEITEEDAIWGCDLALVLTERFVEQIEKKGAGDSKAEDDRKYLVEALRLLGGKRVPRSLLCRKTQRLSKGERDPLLRELEESGVISVDRPEPGKRGPERVSLQ